jgi:hypothetical protein
VPILKDRPISVNGFGTTGDEAQTAVELAKAARRASRGSPPSACNIPAMGSGDSGVPTTHSPRPPSPSPNHSSRSERAVHLAKPPSTRLPCFRVRLGRGRSRGFRRRAPKRDPGARARPNFSTNESGASPPTVAGGGQQITRGTAWGAQNDRGSSWTRGSGPSEALKWRSGGLDDFSCGVGLVRCIPA